MASQIFYTRHDGGVTLMRDGHQSTVSSNNPNFDRILVALKARKFDEVEKLMSVEKTINAAGVSRVRTDCKVFAQNGKIYFKDSKNRKDVELHGSLVDRILRDLGKPGFEKYADSLMNMMENIQKNPIKDVAGELYEWLASGKSPITADGCVLAYKKVRSDGFDQYSGTMDNNPGKLVRMKQADVDTDRRNECSRGLHFASLGYLSKYSAGSGARVMIVKVNPRHIFAIPKDYNCQKGRASEYFVVGEYLSTKNEQCEAFSESFIDEDNVVAAAPEVKFIKTGLKVSLEAVAESYGLVKDGKVKMGSEGPIKWDESEGHEFVIKSFETKTVRAAIKELVAVLESN